MRCPYCQTPQERDEQREHRRRDESRNVEERNLPPLSELPHLCSECGKIKRQEFYAEKVDGTVHRYFIDTDYEPGDKVTLEHNAICPACAQAIEEGDWA
jgi:hypothetical protein